MSVMVNHVASHITSVERGMDKQINTLFGV